MSLANPHLRLVHRTFTSKVQLRQAKGTLSRPLATVESITGVQTPAGPSSLLRSASFNGITHTVVPIVALMGDIVLQAANAPAPELVPLYCLESLPLSAWNGRPIVPLHPNDGQGNYFSANSPEVLDKYGFGLTFNAALSNGALQLDGYLNPVRALAVGPLANDVLARLATDEMIEVSVGVSVLVSDEMGTIKSLSGEDVSYSAVWQQLLYIDHVAMLPAGVEGACSVSVGGCGAPRVNNNATITGAVVEPNGGRSMETDQPESEPKVAAVAVASPSEVWYSNIREQLEAALYDYFRAQVAAQIATQPPMPGVLESEADDLYIWVKAFSNLRVVYERGPGPSYQQYYSLDSAGKVVLGGNEIEVIREEDYRPASKPPVKGIMNRIRDLLRSLKGARHSSADQALTQMIHDCSQNLGATCETEVVDEPANVPAMINDGTVKPMEAATESSPATGDSPAAPCSCKGGSKAMATANVAMTKEAKTALVTKILSAPGSVFKEDQRAVLEAWNEEVLEVLASTTSVDPEGAKPKEGTPVQVVAQAPVAAAATPVAPAALTPEQWWAQAPPEMANVRTLATRAAESDKQEKDNLVKALTTSQEAFTEPQLQAMDLTGLRSLASLTGLFLPRFDYTGAAGTLTRDAASTTQDKEAQVYHNPPRPFDMIRANKSGSKSNGNVAPTSNSAITGAN